MLGCHDNPKISSLFQPYLYKFSKFTFVQEVVVFSLSLYRLVFSMNHYNFILYCKCSAVLLFMFNLARLYALGFTYDTFYLGLILILFIVGTLNSIIRLGVNIGFYIDNLPKSDFLVNTLGDFADKVFLKYTSIKNYYHINPNPRSNSMTTLARYALVATVCTVPIGLAVVYESHRAANANVRCAEASEKQAEATIRKVEIVRKATEQRLAMEEVQGGLRTKEEYRRKYPLE